MDQLKPLKVDRTKLITQAEYARLKKTSRQRVSDMIKTKAVNTVEIRGGILILLD
jgi:transcriptional regulator